MPSKICQTTPQFKTNMKAAIPLVLPVLGAVAEYSITITDRSINNKPLIPARPTDDPYSATGCGGSPCTNVLNAGWIPYTTDPLSDEGGLFLRLSTEGCYPSVISLVDSVPGTNGLEFQTPSDSNILHDGPDPSFDFPNVTQAEIGERE